MTVPRKQLIYDLLLCKSLYVPPLAFKFDSFKCSLAKIHPITISCSDVYAEPFYVAKINILESALNSVENQLLVV